MSIRMLVLAAAFLMPAVHAGVPDAARACLDCHGKSGVSEHADIPTIAGLSDFYFANQLELFKQSARPCMGESFKKHKHGSGASDHCEVAKAISASQAAEMAAHFSALAFVAASQPFDAASAKRGQRVHELRCGRCHEDAGRDPLDDAGILGGQWAAYLRQTLKDYRDGKRWQPDVKAVATKALDDATIEDLVNYYASVGAR